MGEPQPASKAAGVGHGAKGWRQLREVHGGLASPRRGGLVAALQSFFSGDADICPVELLGGGPVVVTNDGVRSTARWLERHTRSVVAEKGVLRVLEHDRSLLGVMRCWWGRTRRETGGWPGCVVRLSRMPARSGNSARRAPWCWALGWSDAGLLGVAGASGSAHRGFRRYGSDCGALGWRP